MNSSTDPIPAMRSVQVDVLRSPSFFLKIVEVVICFIVIGCFFGVVYGWAFFVASSVIGALFHSASLLICYACQQTQIQKTYLEVMLNGWFALALFVCSILLMSSIIGAWVAAGVFSLFLAAIYGGDTFFALQNLMAKPLATGQIDSGLQPNSGVTSYNPTGSPPPYVGETSQPDSYGLHNTYNPPSTLSYQNDPPPHLQQSFSFGIPSKPGHPGV